MKKGLKGILLLTVFVLITMGVAQIYAQDGVNAVATQADDTFLPVVVKLEAPRPLNKIVYAAGYTTDAPRSNIYVINPDGSGRTQLTFSTVATYREPVWSPDGSQIAFTAIEADGGGGYINQIFVINADGSGMYNLVTIPGHHFNPTWSPAGDKIAFSSDMHNPGAETPNDIYVINADGSGTPVNLTNTPAIHESSPSWSPSGTKIAYGSAAGANFDVIEIYAMNADGSMRTNLTNSPTYEYAPRWSPDEQKIVFYRNLGSSSPDREIFVMNADGSGQTRLTNNSGQNFYPDWSPDGSKIVFQTYYDAYADLYIMNADGSGVGNLTNSQYQYASVQPDWQ